MLNSASNVVVGRSRRRSHLDPQCGREPMPIVPTCSTGHPSASLVPTVGLRGLWRTRYAPGVACHSRAAEASRMPPRELHQAFCQGLSSIGGLSWLVSKSHPDIFITLSLIRAVNVASIIDTLIFWKFPRLTTKFLDGVDSAGSTCQTSHQSRVNFFSDTDLHPGPKSDRRILRNPAQAVDCGYCSHPLHCLRSSFLLLANLRHSRSSGTSPS